jgi:hypothetical protein
MMTEYGFFFVFAATAGHEGQKVSRGGRSERPPYDKERSLKFNEEEGREERNNRRNREDGPR